MVPRPSIGSLVLTPKVRHPLLIAFVIGWLAQMIGLVAYSVGTDLAGNALTVSPLNTLMIGVPLYSFWYLLIASAWFLLWKIAGPLKVAVSGLGLLAIAILIPLNEIDLGLQRLRGERVAWSHLRTYLTPHILDSDLIRPITQDRLHLALALATIAGCWLLLLMGVLRQRKRPVSGPSWTQIAMCLVVAGVVYAPLRFAYYHQRDMAQPPYVLLARQVIYPVVAMSAESEARLRTELRTYLDPDSRADWTSPDTPLLRHGGEPDIASAAAVANAPDIIFFVVESLRGRDVGYGANPRPPGKSVTPHLDALAAESVVFPYYIANGDPSPRGFLSIHTGMWEHRWGFIIANFPNLRIDSIPARLRESGYRTMILWGGNPSFDNQLSWARRWYDELDFEMPANGLFYFQTTPDRVLMDKLITRVETHDRLTPGQPFFAYVASNGTHTPFTPEDGGPVPVDPQERYDRCLKNIDAEIGRVLRFLSARPRAKNTVVVVIGDHSDKTTEGFDERWRGMPVDALEWTSALVYGPARLIGPAPRRETFAASHVDLLPTVRSWTGDRRPYAGVGQDLMADIPAGRRSAIAVNSRGFRLDRGGFTLLVDANNPEVHYAYRSFPLGQPEPVPLEQTPFTPDEPRRLHDRMVYWSYLVEQNRVWAPSSKPPDTAP